MDFNKPTTVTVMSGKKEDGSFRPAVRFAYEQDADGNSTSKVVAAYITIVQKFFARDEAGIVRDPKTGYAEEVADPKWVSNVVLRGRKAQLAYDQYQAGDLERGAMVKLAGSEFIRDRPGTDGKTYEDNGLDASFYELTRSAKDAPMNQPEAKQPEQAKQAKRQPTAPRHLHEQKQEIAA